VRLTAIKDSLKNRVVGLHKYANLLDSFENKNKSEPTFCIITPIFDPALISLKKLIIDLKGQTYKNFIHVLVSNGKSPLIESYVAKLNKTDDRFIYVETVQELTVSFAELMTNSGKRRDFCLQHFSAKWYQFLDADAHITDSMYLAKLFVAQKFIKTNIMLVKTEYHGTILPHGQRDTEGQISVANYCISKKVAKKYHYPSNYSNGDPGNDFKYWLKISKTQKVTLLDIFAAIEGDERSYKRMTDKRIEGMLGKEMISVFGNSFDNQLAAKLQPVFDSHMVGHGAEVVRFESAFSGCIGFKGGVATNSCTNAFWILLKALRLRSNDEVLIPGTHFFGIKNVLEILKIKYRVVDVDATIPNASLESIKSNITKNTKVIIGLEYGGYPFAIKELKKHLNKIKRNDIILVLDAANSPFTKQYRKYTAKQYDYALYSFDMNKILVTGEGGMILGNDKKIIEYCRSLSYYGILEKNNSSFAKSGSSKKWWEIGAIDPSLKLSMNNITATIGLSQLDGIKQNLEQRKKVLDWYHKKLRQLVADGHVVIPPVPTGVENSTYLFWIILKNEKLRNELANFLLSRNIYTTVKYQPLGTKQQAPKAWDFFDRSLCLPINPNIHEQLVDYIVSQLISYFYEQQK